MAALSTVSRFPSTLNSPQPSRSSSESRRGDPRRDYWSREVVPALRNLPLNVWERESRGKSRRILIDARLEGDAVRIENTRNC